MANPEHLAILDKGVSEWNSWRSQHLDIHPNLQGADLDGADLSGANLIRANLNGADLYRATLTQAVLRSAYLGNATLRWANLDGAVLNMAYLKGANLSNAKLRHAALANANLGEAILTHTGLMWVDFSGANLSGADFNGADLSHANLDGADLRRAKFNGAYAFKTIFGNVDLSAANGLHEVTHGGPSIVGIDTIYRSGGKVPDSFLRGAGVPDNFISYVQSLIGKPIEFFSCFISYSHKDEEFAKRLHADLQANGVRCWFAPEDIAGGKKLHEQIDEAIRHHDRLLLILSSASIASKWVKTEIAKARKREEKSKRRVLFPVRRRVEETRCTLDFPWPVSAVSSFVPV
jgi:hypothetical protein